MYSPLVFGKDLEDIAVSVSDSGTPIRLRDIGQVTVGPDIRRGAADLDGKGDVVSGIVIMRHGQNALDVIERVKERLREKYTLSSLDIDYHALLKLPGVLRQGDWKVTVAVWMGKEILDIKPGKIEDAYGLAIDIGTTSAKAAQAYKRRVDSCRAAYSPRNSGRYARSKVICRTCVSIS